MDLVDGRYCQGRGRETHAHRHALERSHYVWMNVVDGMVYCIPDGYEVVNKSVAKGKRRALLPSSAVAGLATGRWHACNCTSRMVWSLLAQG